MNHQKELNDDWVRECDGEENEGLIELNDQFAGLLFRRKKSIDVTHTETHRNIKKIGQIPKSKSSYANLQPYTGIMGLAESVVQIPDKATLRHPSLCSLARVFEEVEKTNPSGEPFFVKDLVMIDAKLRDWKRIMPHIKPSYDVKCSPDNQILKRLVQGGAVFNCYEQEEFDLLTSLGEEDLIVKMNTVPSKTCGNIFVIAENEEEIQNLSQTPSVSAILSLPRELSITIESPRDELVKLMKIASKCKVNVAGVRLTLWDTDFDEDHLKQKLQLLADIQKLATEMGFKFSTIDVENEFPESDFEKCAISFSNMVKNFFQAGEVQFYVQASDHITHCSHFLFTRVASAKPAIDSNGNPYQRLLVEWPAGSKWNHNSVPHSCTLKRTLEIKSSLSSKIGDLFSCESDLPVLRVGEWIFWTRVENDMSNKALKNYHSFRFEGPEKKFELNYKPIPGNNVGLRALGSEDWQEILNYGHLLILSEKKNELFDSYLLSESSLFVYPYKVIIKTCGISSPLLCTEALKEVSKKVGTEAESITFSRRSFICPLGQCYPHRSVEEELEFLNHYFPNGQSLSLGNPNSDHWFLYSAKLTKEALMDPTPSLEITMTGRMNPQALKTFWRDEHNTMSVAEKAGMAQLTPGAEIDEYSFTPCGFSYNGLLDRGFVTVHVTPELPLCYISFETNISGLSYSQILDKLISIYQPQHFTVLILNNGGKSCDIPGYKTTHKTNTDMCGVPVTFSRSKKIK